MIYFDTETCGLHGPTVLIQWADGPNVNLHSVWESPIHETLVLIERFCAEGVIAFNLAFDWFHLCQTYTVLLLLAEKVGMNAIPSEHIELYAELESLGRDGPCLKPKHAFDIMLHARKGPYQSTMDRKDIKIRRVPMLLTRPLATELNRRIAIKDIYFARRKDQKAEKWTVVSINNPDGTVNTDFADVVLKFKASAALKVLAADALGDENIILFKDIMPSTRPIEAGWAPFATAISSKERNWEAKVKNKTGYAWPGIIREHISHWTYNEFARKYATKDVVLLQRLYDYFGNPAIDDDDSILAAMVGAVRWRGFAIDHDAIKKLRAKTVEIGKSAPKAPKKVFAYLEQVLAPEEKVALLDQKTNAYTTKRVILEELSKWTKHPVSVRAKACLEARKATKRIEVLDKLLQAGRFHASFKVIGTLSSRMSGGDGLNPQGMDHSKEFRKLFLLAFGYLTLRGGDFSSFEVSIADADYNDPKLRAQLCKCSLCGYIATPDEYRLPTCPKCGQFDEKGEDSRQKFHGIFGMQLAPGLTYSEILATKGSSDDLYDKGKRGGFSQLYGGNWNTLVNKLGVTEEVARRAEQSFISEYPGVGTARQLVADMFCSMRQPEGIGKNVEWHEPAEYIESLTGFRRYFTLENMIAKALFFLSTHLPDSWKRMNIKVVRRDRDQKIGGAVMSALFGAAFQIQAAALRAAANHRIQSTGATLTKELQVRIWTLQPSGVHSWCVQPMNIHDEIMVPSLQELAQQIRDVVNNFIEEKKSIIPLIKIDWSDSMQTWAEK